MHLRLLPLFLLLLFFGCRQKEEPIKVPFAEPQVPEILDITVEELNCALPYNIKLSANVVNILGNEFYQWTVDGLTYSTRFPVIQITDTGVYDIELRVVNDVGVGTFSKQVSYLQTSLPVIPGMETQAFNNNFRVPAKIQFLNRSERATSVSWDFGDGFQSNMDNPEHTYTQAGTYEVKISAYCEADTQVATKTIKIEPEPQTIRFDKFEVLAFPKNYFPEKDDDNTHGGDFYVTLNFNNFQYGYSDVERNKSKLPVFWETPEDWNGDYRLFFTDNPDYEIYLMDKNDSQDDALLLAEFDGLYLKSVFYPRYLDFQYGELIFRVNMSYEN